MIRPFQRTSSVSLFLRRIAKTNILDGTTTCIAIKYYKNILLIHLRPIEFHFWYDYIYKTGSTVEVTRRSHSPSWLKRPNDKSFSLQSSFITYESTCMSTGSPLAPSQTHSIYVFVEWNALLAIPSIRCLSGKQILLLVSRSSQNRRASFDFFHQALPHPSSSQILYITRISHQISHYFNWLPCGLLISYANIM